MAEGLKWAVLWMQAWLQALLPVNRNTTINRDTNVSPIQSQYEKDSQNNLDYANNVLLKNAPLGTFWTTPTTIDQKIQDTDTKLNRLKSTMFSIPSITQNIWATSITTGIPKTNVVEMPQEIKQKIQKEIQPTTIEQVDNTTAVSDLLASVKAHPDATTEQIRQYFPEFANQSDNTINDLLASVKEHPDATIDQINEYFPELSQAQVIQWTTTIKGTAAAQSPINMWKGEWLNPVGKIMEEIDNAVQKIPTITGNKLEQKWLDRINAVTPEERAEFVKKFNRSKFIQRLYGDVDTYIWEAKKTFLDQLLWTGDKWPNVAKMIANIPASTLKTVSGIARAITNPVDTLAWLGKIIFTPEGRQLIIDRYGSLENFSETLSNDPVWVASDVLAIIEWWAGIAKTGAKIAWATTTAARIGEFQKIAWTASDLWLREAIPAGMSKLKQVTQVAENASPIAKVPWAIVKYGEVMTKPLETIKWIFKKIPAIDKNKLAERIQASANKLNPSETAKYKSKIWQSIETTMLENDMVWWHQELFDQSVAKSTEAQARLKTALKVVTEPIQSTLAADSVEHIISSYDRRIPWMDKVIKPFEEMAQRLRDWTATIEDLQKAKTMQAEFQNIFDQYWQVPKWEVEKKLLADNYMEMKKQIEDIAAKYWLDIQQINHDIMKFEGMRRPLWNRLAKDMNLDIFSLTDSILAAWSLAHPAWRWLLVAKKIAWSPWMKSKIASALYKKTWITGMKPRLE